MSFLYVLIMNKETFPFIISQPGTSQAQHLHIWRNPYGKVTRKRIHSLSCLAVVTEAQLGLASVV